MKIRAATCRRTTAAAAALALMTVFLAACGDGEPSRSGERERSWDLVALGDSMVTGQGVAWEQAYVPQYAAILEDEFGVRVNVLVHGFTGGVDTVADWGEVVATDERLRADLAKAEVVTVFVGAHNVGLATLGGDCIGDWPDTLRACFQDATATMPEDFDRLLGSIRSLVPDGATILVGYDGGLPPSVVERWSGQPYWEQMKEILIDSWRPGLYEAAQAHGARVIGFYEALFGPNVEFLHPEFLQPDQLHFNADGHRFLAELHAAGDALGEE